MLGIKKILNILLPITLPNAISAFFFIAAITEVANSGNEVPNATTVKPIIASDTPKRVAISTALFTMSSPPIIKPNKPPIMAKSAFHTGCGCATIVSS